MLSKRNSADIVQTALKNLSANTDLTFFGAGSVTRTLIESLAREIELLYDSIDLNLSQSRLATASGAFLDIIASQFGLTRFGGNTGQILAEDRAVRFFVKTGRLIDYLRSGSTTTGIIPSGTTITNKAGTVTYSVTSDVAFPANAKSVFVPVAPLDTTLGSRNNVPAGALSVHSLSSPNIFVENSVGLITSRDPESDSELRLRISRAINSRVPGSRAAVLEACFAFPGVSDIRINQYKFGAGSFEILVVPIGSRISPNILSNIEAAANSIVPYGIRVQARGPDVVDVAMVIQIDINSSSFSETKQVAAKAVENNLREYLGSIPMGGELIMNSVRSIVMDSHPSIRDMNILQFMVNCKPQVIANYRLKKDEVFDLDQKVQKPILII